MKFLASHLTLACCLCLLLAFSGYIHADSMEAAASAPAASGVPAASDRPGAFSPPVLDQPMLILKDGRGLVAGGSARSHGRSDHVVGEDSEIWDPKTGHWQVASGELRFDQGLEAQANQLDDGRVLFFAQKVTGETPEYQARLWNPKDNKVQKLTVGIKPKPDTDIAVLADGRVLIINGAEGSADTWDSRIGKVTHREVPQLENSRWRALPLRNKTVLVLETFADDEAVARKRASQSAALLWDTASDAWKALDPLPVVLGQGGSLTELGDGSVHAELAGGAYRWTAAGGTAGAGWAPASSIVPPPPEPAALPAAQAPAVPVAAAPKPAGAAPAEQPTYLEMLEQYKWILLAVFFPLVLYFVLRRVGAEKVERVFNQRRKSLVVLGPVLAIVLFALLTLPAMYSFGHGLLIAHSTECVNEPPVYLGGKPTMLGRMQQWAACMDRKNGIIEKVLFHSTKSRVMALPSVPCRYVGVWETGQGSEKIKLTLTDDSQFVRGKEVTGADTGSWGVVGDEMLWIHDGQQQWWWFSMDVYRIQPEGRSRFTLINEERDSSTVYTLVDAGKSNTCTP